MTSHKRIGHGKAGAVAWMRRAWLLDGLSIDTLEDVSLAGAHIAISEADARRCWGWRNADEAAPVVDAVAKPVDAPPAVDHAGKPSDTSDGGPAWLTEKNYNLAWLFGERAIFEKRYGKRGHYMKKLVAHLKTLGVIVPGADPAREIRRLEDAATGKQGKTEAATFVSGLVGRKSVGT